ncbi:membrane protein [Caenispirillum salinarum AK4]|uniref:Membrane protein n=1 Tax=Caenispirillum salinarum AK4 TaxID=1238182 RepID=K9H350_9PROT|nr:Bax inhibitor-1/YccA family protein [Caenispirillum salinarum]EKV32007.1 membrane protein [Caenispirillum salinarum AK4]
MALNPERSYGARTGAEARADIDQGLRSYMLKVYNYMASGVALTGIVAMLSNPQSSFGLLAPIFYAEVAPDVFQANLLLWVSMFAAIGMVFFMSFRIGKMSPATAQAVFWGYAALNGVWMSGLFLTYTDMSITRVFFIAAGAFAGLSLWGYTTKRDLTAMGSFLMIGLIGLIIAMVVNIFLQSPMMMFVISAAGVLIFAGLTAYDTQKIKDMYIEGEHEGTASKKAIMGALALYLDFINLFIMLLHLFGERR